MSRPASPTSRPRFDEIVVVCGLPRSGTSLLMQMLAAGGMPLFEDDARAPDADNPRGYHEHGAVKRTLHDASWTPLARGNAVKVVEPLVRALPEGERLRVLRVRRDLHAVLASQAAMLSRRDGDFSRRDGDSRRRPGASGRQDADPVRPPDASGRREGAAMRGADASRRHDGGPVARCGVTAPPGPATADEALARAFEAELAATDRWLATRPRLRWLALEHAELLRDPAAQAARIAAFLDDLLPLDREAMARAVDPTLARQRPRAQG